MHGGAVEGLTKTGHVVSREHPNAVSWRLDLGHLQSKEDPKQWENRYLLISDPAVAEDIENLIQEIKERATARAYRELRNLIGAAER